MLALVGASVASVTFAPDGIVVGLRRRRSKHRCPCGWQPGRATTVRCAGGATWTSGGPVLPRSRHLLDRLSALSAGAHRGGPLGASRGPARRDFQDVVAWLAQARREDHDHQAAPGQLWEAVAKIVIDVVTKAIDDTRLENLYRIGVDEVSIAQGTPLLDRRRRPRSRGVRSSRRPRAGTTRSSRPSTTNWATSGWRASR